MADPTYFGVPGQGPKVTLIDANLGQGESNFFDTYGYRNAVIWRWAPSDASVTEVHHIWGTGSPQGGDPAIYSSSPVGSLYYDWATGDIYTKDAAGDNWGKVTVVS